ncbi:hypothetical protein J6590_008711 [Homalodisca vitripennis]|nr:hypothetical protein J6590_008711 [Homalodisca vitripennis]
MYGKLFGMYPVMPNKPRSLTWDIFPEREGHDGSSGANQKPRLMISEVTMRTFIPVGGISSSTTSHVSAAADLGVCRQVYRGPDQIHYRRDRRRRTGDVAYVDGSRDHHEKCCMSYGLYYSVKVHTVHVNSGFPRAF